jgi:hypothetical protein
MMPKVKLFEDHLGLRITGEKGNAMRFIFSKFDSKQPDRQFSLVMNVAGRNYEVSSYEPALPKMDQLVNQLKRDRDFYSFLRQVRRELQTQSQ